MTKALNVFKGPDAVRDYLDPGEQPYLPMVFIVDTLGGKPHDERDSSRRSAETRPWMDFEDQQGA